MDPKYQSLFTPWKIGNVEIPNRIVQCSMGGTSLFGWMEPSHLDKEAAYFLLNRAQDGVGLILPGMQCIKDAIGGRWLYQNDKMFKDLKVYMEEFHKTGAKLFVQLAAGMGRSMAITKPMIMLLKHPLLGKIASPVADIDYITASASATPNRWYDEIKSRPMTVKEIQDQVEAFAKTSKKLMEAGVDGVEIHAVHEGYLLDQFTISNMNYRTDQYGGSFENRFRFPVEIVQAIKAACGPDFPVSLRYSVVSKTKTWGKGAMPYEKDFKEFGRDMEESERAIKYLADAGYDMFNCDNGTYDAWYWAHPPQYMPDNCNLEYVENIKKFTDKPVIFEKTNELGGLFLTASAMTFKENDKDLITWYKREIEKAGIEVRFNTEVNDLNTLRGFDEIIVATGSVPRTMPQIKGFEKTLSFTDILKDKKDVGDKVLFIGGVLSSCEAAYDMLLNFGKHPIIVEYAGDLVAAQATCLANTSYLRDAMEYHKVPVYLHSTVTEITDKGCTVKNVQTGETFFVECDSVVNGIGFVPTPVGGKTASRKVKGRETIHRVGDCVAIGNLRTVIWRAWDVCMKI